MWSAKPQCFSSASSQRAGEEEMEEEEEGHLPLCHHKSKELSIDVIHLCNRKNESK